MTLPNADRAVVDLGKVAHYLLNAAHPDNGGKARFFEGVGFSSSDVTALAAALRAVAASGDVVIRVESPHGEKYVVDGHLEVPSGKQPVVRTIWIIDRGQDFPRLVTAYPQEQ